MAMLQRPNAVGLTMCRFVLVEEQTRKMKQMLPAPTPATESFGGDYHKCESTFQPRTPPAVTIGATKRKRPIPPQGKRKDARS